MIRPSSQRLWAFLLAAGLGLSGCTQSIEEDVADDDAALASAEPIDDILRVGAKLETTANVSLRSEPIKGENRIQVIAKGETVEVFEATAKNSYVRVRYEDQTGWVHGGYLRTSAANEDGTSSGTVVRAGTCKASFYGPGYHGKQTANGEIFDQNGLTAARQSAMAETFPFRARVRVTNVDTGASVTVKINDTGPLRPGRCLDLAQGAFEKIAPLSQGVADIRYEVLR